MTYSEIISIMSSVTQKSRQLEASLWHNYVSVYFAIIWQSYCANAVMVPFVIPSLKQM